MGGTKRKNTDDDNDNNNNSDEDDLDLVEYCSDIDSISVEKKPHIAHRLYENIKISEANALNMNFGLQVANHILQETLTTASKDDNKAKNFICSPLSITVALDILAVGATGDMLKQLLGLLEYDTIEDVNTAALRLKEVLKGFDDEDAPYISFANALWVHHKFSLKPPFLQVLSDVHDGKASSVDFSQADEVAREANKWAEEITKGFIKQILSKDAIEKDTMMIIANALYFKGAWVKKFKPEQTKNEDFYLLNGDKVQAPFMTLCYSEFDYGTFEDNCQVLRMLYREGEAMEKGERSFSMYIFLPNEKDGLPNLMANIKMDSNMFKDRIKLKGEQIDKLSIPKFSFECNLSLVEPMKSLGLTLPFITECLDLSEIVDCSNGYWLNVNDVRQKCRIEINGRGTKAAAFTKMQMLCGCGPPETPPPPINFVADHPFMFIIREDFTGAILFVGTMLDPR